MCGRYLYFDGRSEKIRGFLKTAEKRLPAEVFARISIFEVFPGSEVFAGIFDGRAFRSVIMQWGMPMQKKTVINARSETLMQSPFFRNTSPCALLCSGYYEWSAERYRFYFTLPEGQPMYLAGVWRKENDVMRFVILTEPAHAGCRAVHPRQPVVLSEKNAQAWCRTMALPVLDHSIRDRIIIPEHQNKEE